MPQVVQLHLLCVSCSPTKHAQTEGEGVGVGMVQQLWVDSQCLALLQPKRGTRKVQMCCLQGSGQLQACELPQPSWCLSLIACLAFLTAADAEDAHHEAQQVLVSHGRQICEAAMKALQAQPPLSVTQAFPAFWLAILIP